MFCASIRPSVLQKYDDLMIRAFTPTDMDAVLGVWLNASIQAHDFVAPDYWVARVDDMQQVHLPASESWVYEEDGEVLGFLSLVDATLAALFVAPGRQGEGIGARLLEHAQRLRPELELRVYAANTRSIAFYEKHGFRRLACQPDGHSGHEEWTMTWASARSA